MSKRTNNRLSTSQTVRVVDWLRSHVDRLRADQTSEDKVRAEIKADLGIDVSPSSLGNLCKAIGLRWLKSTPKPSSVDNAALESINQRIAKAEELIEAMGERQNVATSDRRAAREDITHFRNDLQVVAVALAALIKDLGSDVSCALAEIAIHGMTFSDDSKGNGDRHPLFQRRNGTPR